MRQNCRAAPSLIPRDESYVYDGLQRLQNAQRGTLSSGSITSRQFEQDWTLDALGNWPTFKERDTDAGATWDLNQSRVHNKANEIDVDDDHTNAAGASIAATAGANWYDPTYDAAGNMTVLPQPANPVAPYPTYYDAWNRLVEVKTTTRTIQKNEFDGLHRRIVKEKYVSGSLNETRHYYYNQAWQVVEERKEPSGGAIDTDPINQYVWHPNYIDALAMRRHDGNVAGAIVGAGEGKHYYLQDANFNVTAVVNDAGAVLERYAYTPYGTPTILDDNFAVDSDGISDISNVILYTGRERDPETGLQLNRNRFYASHLGRWLNRDPKSYRGSPGNLYCYVAAKPTRFYDPFGLEKICCKDYPTEKSYVTWKCWPSAIGAFFMGGACTPPMVEASGNDAVEIVGDLEIGFKDGGSGLWHGGDFSSSGSLLYSSRKHSALRHCIWSGILAKRCSCGLSACVIDGRDEWQYACKGQPAINTRQAFFNDDKGRECAGCTGSDHVSEPGEWHRDEGGRHFIPFGKSSEQKIVECCLGKLLDGSLATDTTGPSLDDIPLSNR